MTATSPGERARRKRKRERMRVAHDAKLNDLRANAACCGTCRSFCKYPHERGKHYCSKDSDWRGYVIVTQTDLCVSHVRRTEVLDTPTQGTPTQGRD